MVIAGDVDELSRARRRLERVGVARPAAVAIADRVLRDADTTRYRRSTFTELLDEAGERPIQVVDVRGDVEWHRGHIAGAIHIPLHLLTAHADHLPHTELWVHCGSGHRSSIAASILQRAGHDVTHIDDAWKNADVAQISERLSHPRSSDPTPDRGPLGEESEQRSSGVPPISVGADHG